MKVAIVGAGVSGLVTARALEAVGIAATVFERCPDVGGVWSRTRAYPGLTAQDDRRSYAFSDRPMSGPHDEHPSADEVRGYLQAYAAHHGLDSRIRLSTEVVEAAALPRDDGWTVTTRGPAGVATEHFDWLVAANGAFSTPHMPTWPGADEFRQAGGVAVVPSELTDGSVLADKDVVVIGWGKTACDIAVASAAVARSTTLIARRLIWKYPKQVGGGVTFRHLLLTRLGQRILYGPYRTAAGRIRVSRLPEWLPRLAVKRQLGRVISSRSGLRALGLQPQVSSSISTSLVTDGFFDAVRSGSIQVRAGDSVVALRADGGRPAVQISDGRVVGSEVLVVATGFDQSLGFLDRAVQDRLSTASHGALRLDRRILAVDMPRLAFIGWSSSYHTPLTSEVAAIWLAAHLSGQESLRRRTGSESALTYPLTPERAVALGVAQVPHVTLTDLDALLRDLGSPLPLAARVKQWLVPIDPKSYQHVLPQLQRRRAQPTSRRPSPVSWPGHSSPLGASIEAFVRADQPAHRWLARHPRVAMSALVAMTRLPVLRARPSGSVEGQSVRTALGRSSAIRTVVHRTTAVLALPADVEQYAAAPGRQTLRRKTRQAEKRGIHWSSVQSTDERLRLLDLADARERTHPENRYRRTSPDNRGMLPLSLWLAAYGADDRPLMLAVAPVDGDWSALRYFRTLESSDDASLARYLMSTVLIGELAARGARYLVDPESPFLLPDGLRHFQKMLGYSLVQVRLDGAHRSGTHAASSASRGRDLRPGLGRARAVGDVHDRSSS